MSGSDEVLWFLIAVGLGMMPVGLLLSRKVRRLTRSIEAAEDRRILAARRQDVHPAE